MRAKHPISWRSINSTTTMREGGAGNGHWIIGRSKTNKQQLHLRGEEAAGQTGTIQEPPPQLSSKLEQLREGGGGGLTPQISALITLLRRSLRRARLPLPTQSARTHATPQHGYMRNLREIFICRGLKNTHARALPWAFIAENGEAERKQVLFPRHPSARGPLPRQPLHSSAPRAAAT